MLVIGSKNRSSWSLRPWLLMTESNIAFEEHYLPFHLPKWREHIKPLSPAGKVPVLIAGTLPIWDSLAICEYLAESHPEKHLWPADVAARARARAICCEMHSGFMELRTHCSMRLAEAMPAPEMTPALLRDIARIEDIWHVSLQVSGGPYLFGPQVTIADAMFAPVVSRFTTYGIAVKPVTEAYMKAIWELDGMEQWRKGAHAEVAAGVHLAMPPKE